MKKHFLFILGVFTTCLIFLSMSCNGASVFIPEAAQLETAPLKVAATQLYQEYMTDEAAADARYKGKEIWITEARVNTYLESESGCYLTIRWHPEELFVYEKEVEFFIPGFSVCTLKLEPQLSEGFKDIPPDYDVDLGDGYGTLRFIGGYAVETIGECQGISEGVVSIEINWIAKTGGSSPELEVGGW
jgi:hypothetical protein